MAYTIAFNEVGGFWEVFQDGRRISRGFSPIDAIRAAVEFGGMPDNAAIRSALLTSANNVINTNNATTRENNAGTGQSGTAGQGATATPDAQQRAASTPPPPVSSATNPEVPPPTPEPSTLTPTNTSPEPVTEPAGTQALTDPTPINGLDLPPEPDEFGNLDQAIERQQASEPVLSEDGEEATGIRRNTETGEVFYTTPPKGEEPAFDEFAGVDEAVAEQQRIAINTSGLPVRAEDGSVAEGVAINPETGETYFTGPRGTTAAELNTRTNATQQDEANFLQKEDWRVRLSLAPKSKYLYNVDGAQGILAPLAATDGILFPYTPSINVTYAASYEPADVAHSNYKVYQYKNSSVDNIQITCNFTAQDTFEANYLLAVIHFLRTVTKMFYGNDENPSRGSPPPLCFLSGLGAFQFDAHPLAITNFTYSLPDDVDYIRAGTTTTTAGVNKSAERSPNNSGANNGGRNTNVGPGATVPAPQFRNVPGGTVEPTYVPTKIQIQITAIPIITRNNISNNFSVKDYATGQLLQGSKTQRGGIW